MVALLGAPACRKLEALKQRCVAGDVSACESSCSKGVVGEGGCFHAGELHRQQGAREGAAKETQRAAEFFAKSCDGGYGDGCLLAAQMIEAPYATPEVSAASGELPKTIADADVLARERRLASACDRGSSGGCKKLGDVLIGKNAERAGKAYEKACRAGAQAEACVAARAREVGIAERWRVACTHGVADACTRLGNLLFAVDPPRAMRLFQSESQLRGVGELAGGEAQFVRERARAAKLGIGLDEASPSPAAPGWSLLILPPRVVGPVAFVEVERLLHAHEAELAACVTPGPAPRRVDVKLVIDLTGDVWRATTTGPDVAPVALSCLSSALENLSLPMPSPAVATVETSLVVPASSEPAGRPAVPTPAK